MKSGIAALACALSAFWSVQAAAQAKSALPLKPPALIPTEVLARPPLVSGPSLSPDGTMLLAMLSSGGKASLGLIGVRSGEIRTFGLPKDHEIVSYRWAGSGKVLISLGKTEDLFGEDLYVTRLIAYDVASRESVFIGKRQQGQKGDDILHVDPDGKSLLLSIQKTFWDWPSVYKVDLADASLKEVVAPKTGVHAWYADGAGMVRAGLGYESAGDRWSMIYRGPKGGSFRQVSTRTMAGKVPSGDLRFALDSDQGFILSDEKAGRDAIHRFDFASLSKGELVFEAPANDVEHFVLSDDGREVRAAYFTDTRDRVHWFDPEMKEIQEAIDKAVGSKEAWIVSRSRDNSALLVLVTGANDPGSYYYFMPATAVMKHLAFVNEKMKPHRLAPAKAVAYKARDGLEIHGYLTLPPGRAPKGLPLIVMPHGGPYGIRDRGDYDPEVQLLANRGYAVLQPNYRGSGSYGKAFEERGTGQWGRAMQDDLDDGMDWLVRDGIADPKRVCIAGGSYGGYAAMWGATRNPERYRCAISFAGVSDLPRQLKYSRDYFLSAKSARKWKERVRGDETFRLADISPIEHVEKLKVPVLITHGDKDQRVPLKQSALYAAALKKAGKPHEYVIYEGEGHGFDDPVKRKDYFDRVEAFLRKHNPPD